MTKCRYCFVISIIILLLSSCGKGAVSHSTEQLQSSTQAESLSEIKAVSPKEYLSNQPLSENMQQMLYYLNRPVSELVKAYGKEYSVSSSDPNETIGLSFRQYADRMHFSGNRSPFDYDIYIKGNMLSETDLVQQVGIAQTGFEVVPGIKIGASVDEMRKESGIIFNADGYAYGYAYPLKEYPDFYFTFEFVNGVLRYVYAGTTSLMLWQEKEGPKTPDIPESTLRILDECFSYYQSRGFSYLTLDTFEYKGTEAINNGNWDCFKTDNLTGNNDPATLRVGKQYPYQVILDENATENRLLWLNGGYVHPMSAFIGTWVNSSDPSYKVKIHSITQYGDIVFDLVLGDVTLNNCNGFLNPTLGGDIASLFGATYAVHFDYYDGNSLVGTIQYDGKLWSYNATLGIGHGVSFSFPGGTVYSFDKCVEHGDIIYEDDEGIVRQFGLDDPDGGHYTKGATGEKDTSRILLNQYLNRLHKTNNRDHAESECSYYGQYYFAEWNRTYSVWSSTTSSYIYYVDTKNEEIIREDPYYPEESGFKDIVWQNGMIPVTGAEFIGKWNGDSFTVNIRSVDDEAAKIDLHFQGALIPDMEVKAAVLQDGEQVGLYFAYEEGDRILGGFVHLNYHTWAADLHINDSNIKGINLGLYPMRRDGVIPKKQDVQPTKPEESNVAEEIWASLPPFE